MKVNTQSKNMEQAIMLQDHYYELMCDQRHTRCLREVGITLGHNIIVPHDYQEGLFIVAHRGIGPYQREFVALRQSLQDKLVAAVAILELLD